MRSVCNLWWKQNKAHVLCYGGQIHFHVGKANLKERRLEKEYETN